MRLLLSLQNADELAIGSKFDFAWYDLKDPSRGSLGCPDSQVAEAFLDYANEHLDREQKPISIALGELLEWNTARLDASILREFDFVKIALASLGGSSVGVAPILQRLTEVSDALPATSRIILTHYADFEIAQSPTWEATIELACHLGSEYVLIDTYDKKQSRLIGCYSADRCREMVRQAHADGLKVSLAGSVQFEHLPLLQKTGASIIGIRGAACQHGARVASLSHARLKQLESAASHNKGFELCLLPVVNEIDPAV